ncbi:MAG TPA: hypothetical protein VJB82_00050 [Candidatus Peribacterales bacterium]|nr:hypothetical protein [Candidatus Peribacterales bacterium]
MTNNDSEPLIQRFVDATLQTDVNLDREYETILNSMTMTRDLVRKQITEDTYPKERKQLIESDTTPEALAELDARSQGVHDVLDPNHPRQQAKVEQLQIMIGKVEAVMGKQFLLNTLQGKITEFVKDSSPELSARLRGFIRSLIRRKMEEALRPIEDDQFQVADRLYSDDDDKDDYLENIWNETERRLMVQLMND